MTRAITTHLHTRSPNGSAMRDRKVQRLVRVMRRVMPWLRESDIPAARAWAQLEILSDLAFAHLRREGMLQTSGENKGEPRKLLADFRSLRSVQIVYARELAMTPAARAAMKLNNGLPDLAAAMIDAEVVETQGAEDTGRIKPKPMDAQAIEAAATRIGRPSKNGSRWLKTSQPDKHNDEGDGAQT